MTAEDVFIQTGLENAHSFLASCNSMRAAEFLNREEYMSLRSCKTSDLIHESCVCLNSDIDGIVLEHANLCGITIPVRYINILPSGCKSLIPIYSLIKKHLPLVKYNSTGYGLLREAVGAQIFSDSGWQCFITVLPVLNCMSNIRKTCYRSLVNDWFAVLKSRMVELLKSNDTNLKRESVKKNRINDVSKWTLSPADWPWYRDLLETAVESVDIPHGFEVFKFSCRFGERDVNEIRLSDYVDSTTVKRMSIHAAVLVDLSPVGMNAFWGRNGLYPLIGNRGQIWKSLILSESCNFQSNLDGKKMAITPHLYELAYHPETLQFIQFYVDTPHMYPSGKYNPISGSIVTTGLLHPKSVQHVHKSAVDYLSVMQENSTKITFPVCPRVEIVCLTDEITDTLKANDFINLDKLSSLMNNYSLLIPIAEEGDGGFEVFFTRALKEVCFYLCDELKALYERNKGLGGYFPTWKSFQIECALEMLFYGKTLCFLSRQISDLLLSHRLGCLTLQEPSATTINEDETPPLKIWTQSDEQQERITRAFKLTNYLNSSLPVVGKQVVIILLNDLIHDRRYMKIQLEEHVIITCLKSGTKPSWSQCVGVLTSRGIAETIVKGVYLYPLVFGRVLQLLRLKELDAVTVIIQGLKELNFHYFPALRMTDALKHHNSHWTGKTVWSVTQQPSDIFDGRKMTKEIATQMVHKDLIYESKMSYIFNDEEIIFPWIEPVMKRIQGLPIDQQGQTELLVLISCLAFLMDGYFVKYDKMRYLSVPFSITKLQDLNILSHYLVQLKGCRLYRLHQDIDYRIKTYSKIQINTKKLKTNPNLSNPLIDEAFDGAVEENEKTFQHEPELHRSANFMGRWSPAEIEILHDLVENNEIGNKWKKIYEKYSHKCREKNIPDRSYTAFKRKIININEQLLSNK